MPNFSRSVHRLTAFVAGLVMLMASVPFFPVSAQDAEPDTNTTENTFLSHQVLTTFPIGAQGESENTNVRSANTTEARSASDPVVSGLETPLGVAVDQTTHMVYVTSVSDDTVTIVDANTNQVEGVLTVPESPTGIGVNGMTRRGYILHANDTVSVLDLDTQEIIAEISGGDFQSDIAIDQERNRVYITNMDDNTVTVIDGESNTVFGTLAVATAPKGIDVNETTDRIYVAGDYAVTVVDANTLREVDTIFSDVIASDLTVNEGDNAMVVVNEGWGNFLIIDTQSQSTIAEVFAHEGSTTSASALYEASNRFVVANFQDGSLSVLSPETYTIERVIDLPGASGPHEIAIDQELGRAFVVSILSGTLTVVDLFDDPSDEFVTRGEAVVRIVDEMLGAPHPEVEDVYQTSQFNDIALDDPLFPYVHTALMYGAVESNGSTSFRPNDVSPKVETMKMMRDFLNRPSLPFPVETFDDVEASDWFVEIVTTFQNYCIVSAPQDRLLHPADPLTSPAFEVMLSKSSQVRDRQNICADSSSFVADFFIRQTVDGSDRESLAFPGDRIQVGLEFGNFGPDTLPADTVEIVIDYDEEYFELVGQPSDICVEPQFGELKCTIPTEFLGNGESGFGVYELEVREGIEEQRFVENVAYIYGADNADPNEWSSRDYFEFQLLPTESFFVENLSIADTEFSVGESDQEVCRLRWVNQTDEDILMRELRFEIGQLQENALQNFRLYFQGEPISENTQMVNMSEYFYSDIIFDLTTDSNPYGFVIPAAEEVTIRCIADVVGAAQSRFSVYPQRFDAVTASSSASVEEVFHFSSFPRIQIESPILNLEFQSVQDIRLELGEVGAELSKLRATSYNNQDIVIEQITFEIEDIEDGDIQNMFVEYQGDSITNTIVETSDKRATFTFENNGFVLSGGDTRTFRVKGDIAGGVGNTFIVEIDSVSDVIATSANGVNADIGINDIPYGAFITIEDEDANPIEDAIFVSLSDTTPVAQDIPVNSPRIPFFEILLSNDDNDFPVEIQGLTVHHSQMGLSQDIDEICAFDGIEQRGSCRGFTSDEEIAFLNLITEPIVIPAGGTKKILIAASMEPTVPLGQEHGFFLKGESDIMAINSNTGAPVEIMGNFFVTGNNMTTSNTEAGALDFEFQTVEDDDVTVGDTAVELSKIRITASEAEDVVLKQMALEFSGIGDTDLTEIFVEYQGEPVTNTIFELNNEVGVFTFPGEGFAFSAGDTRTFRVRGNIVGGVQDAFLVEFDEVESDVFATGANGFGVNLQANNPPEGANIDILGSGVIFSTRSAPRNIAPDTDNALFGLLAIDNYSETIEVQDGLKIFVNFDGVTDANNSGSSNDEVLSMLSGFKLVKSSTGVTFFGPEEPQIEDGRVVFIFSDSIIVEPNEFLRLDIVGDIEAEAEDGAEFSLELDMSSVAVEEVSSGEISFGGPIGQSGEQSYDITPLDNLITQGTRIKFATVVIEALSEQDASYPAKADDVLLWSGAFSANDSEDLILRALEISTAEGTTIQPGDFDNFSLYLTEGNVRTLLETGGDIDGSIGNNCEDNCDVEFSSLDSDDGVSGMLIPAGSEVDIEMRGDVASTLSGIAPVVSFEIANEQDIDVEDTEGDDAPVVLKNTLGAQYTLVESGVLRVEFRENESRDDSILIADGEERLEDIAVFRFEAEQEDVEVTDLMVDLQSVIDDIDGDGVDDTHDCDESEQGIQTECYADVIDLLGLFYEDGTSVLKEGGQPAETSVVNAGAAQFEDLDLIIQADHSSGTLILVKSQLNEIERNTGAKSGMTFRANLSFGEGESEVRGSDSGVELTIAEGNLMVDGEGADTNAGNVMYALRSRVVAELSPSQTSLLTGGTRDALKFDLIPFGGEEAYLREVNVNIAQAGSGFGVCELSLKDGSDVLSSLVVPAGNPGLSGDQTLSIGECDDISHICNPSDPALNRHVIDPGGDTFIVEALIGDSTCSGNTPVFEVNDDVTFELDINGAEPGEDDIVFQDYGTNGEDGVDMRWIDLGEDDESTTKIQNTLGDAEPTPEEPEQKVNVRMASEGISAASVGVPNNAIGHVVLNSENGDSLLSELIFEIAGDIAPEDVQSLSLKVNGPDGRNADASGEIIGHTVVFNMSGHPNGGLRIRGGDAHLYITAQFNAGAANHQVQMEYVSGQAMDVESESVVVLEQPDSASVLVIINELEPEQSDATIAYTLLDSEAGEAGRFTLDTDGDQLAVASVILTFDQAVDPVGVQDIFLSAERNGRRLTGRNDRIIWNGNTVELQVHIPGGTYSIGTIVDELFSIKTVLRDGAVAPVVTGVEFNAFDGDGNIVTTVAE